MPRLLCLLSTVSLGAAIVAATAIGTISAVPRSALAREAVPAPAVETPAKSVLIVDAQTGAVLFQKNPDLAFPPASLAKLMTMEVVFDALKNGRLRLDQSFPVSEHAWRTGGAPSGTSTMFAAVRSSIPVDALIRGVIVQSANDGAIVLAEGMAGSEEAFAERMNERAAAIGLTGSRFVNPTGLPAPGQSVTARDLLRLAQHLSDTYPDLYRIYSEPSFEWNRITQRSRNPLLGMNIGAEGFEIGFAEGFGYSVVGAVRHEGRRMLLVATGLESARDRSAEARRLIEWARGSFDYRQFFAANAAVGRAAVFGGVGSHVPFVVQDAVAGFVPTSGEDRVSALIRYDGPLIAPVKQGTRIGELEIRVDDQTSLTRDLYAGADVPAGSFGNRALGAVQELAFGWVRAF